MLKKIRTFLKFIGLKWGGGRHKPEVNAEYSFVFVDNKFENFIEQVKIFFESGFLDSKKTVLIVKFYGSNYYNIESVAKGLGVKVIFYLFYRQIPSLNGRIIFYPYNAQSNCRLILNRSACHVFLTHGESNKKASVNRMARLYDYVLAAGDISSQRYVNSGVFTRQDIEAGRVIRVGASLSAKCLEYTTAAGNPCLVYMPTWEGGLDEENFSSIACQDIADILWSILQGLNIQRILIKCHPNTGGRIRVYKTALALLINSLMEKDIDVYVDPDSEIFLKKYPELQRKVNFDRFKLNVLWGVVDVSAAEFMLAAKKIPTIVLLRQKNKFFAPSEYMRMRNNALIDMDGVVEVHAAIEYLKNSNQEDEFMQNAFQKEEYLRSKNTQEIAEILISRFRNEICNKNLEMI
jgi:hypothetical protein